ncbi:hypothetical protein [Noviherbaspirillum galbum]|uniref:Uncharacterized protein n=1 Tax=Noviherbaspirillum galbum TaxID=2709383 RepID=A0A6B3SXT0_9BURK|nr:hypothetical protein [Noviherbaspirillum galbum]NEX63352.1 hypothetical protein [Noviherbaspirillum galbum]
MEQSVKDTSPYIYRPLTIRERVVHATGVVILSLVIAAVFTAKVNVWAGIPVILIGLVLAYLAGRAQTTIERRPGSIIEKNPVISEEERLKNEAASRAAQEKIDKIFEAWYVRYPLGFFLIYLAWYTADSGAKWYVPVGAVVMALACMHEVFWVLLIVAIFGGIVWAAFGAISGLPVSVAIIIGALIIANSRK